MKEDTSTMNKRNLRGSCHFNWPATWRLKTVKQSKRKRLRTEEVSSENSPMDTLIKQAKQSQCFSGTGNGFLFSVD